jgi:AcrR family transcriptional regulator
MNMFILSEDAPDPIPSKADRTRERILQTALTLFKNGGYESTTMREIARESDSSLGLAYRYFSSKEQLVLAFYQMLAGQFVTKISQLPKGTVARRFAVAMETKLALIEPYRELIGVLLSAALNPASRVSVLGKDSAGIRAQMQEAFDRIVRDSDDAPSAASSAALAKLLYVAHLGLLFFRVNDPSEAGRATRELLAWIEKTLSCLPLVSELPLFSEGLLRLAASLDTVFGGHAHEHATE